MGKIVPPTAAVLAVTLAALLVILLVSATPAYPQTVSEDLASDEDGNLVGPRPPDYEVDENGMLIIGGDVLTPCSNVGRPAAPSELRGATPRARNQIEQARRESIRACRAAGYDTAGDLPASASPPSPGASAPDGDGTLLPETGGVALPALLLLAAGVSLAAGAPLALMRTRR